MALTDHIGERMSVRQILASEGLMSEGVPKTSAETFFAQVSKRELAARALMIEKLVGTLIKATGPAWRISWGITPGNVNLFFETPKGTLRLYPIYDERKFYVWYEKGLHSVPTILKDPPVQSIVKTVLDLIKQNGL